LKAAGCTRIDREKVSVAKADRRELLRRLKALASGDVVTVTRIDRVARSTFELFAIVKQIVVPGGQFRSLAEPYRLEACLGDATRGLTGPRHGEGPPQSPQSNW